MSEGTDLGSRILAELDGCSSKKPARGDELAARLGASAAQFQRTVEALAARCQINTALIQRKGDKCAWLALWPTGVIRHDSRGWRADGNRSLFDVPAKTNRQILREVSGPKVQPARKRPSPATSPAAKGKAEAAHRASRRSASQLRGEILALLEGRRAADAITRRALAVALGATGKNPLATYSRYINRALDYAPWVAFCDVKHNDRLNHVSRALYDSRTDGAEASPPKPERAHDDSVVCHLATDGTLEVRFGPDYAKDQCIVDVRAIRRELSEARA